MLYYALNTMSLLNFPRIQKMQKSTKLSLCEYLCENVTK